ncbi:MAG: nicotinate (nicotinamide) nucleotide adenylyltransferase [Firmicutes bacterium]|nr:nicotinate (nicotinamide) nucleotide adenylyltransferase [Bacillota bacterium]MCM1401646.1 nicotinate (nicotinamide) nucleotide adenylyltransferase [Bacteroides sp.]MCM1477532.1 nicotinate (nicotinamide) nucleotide adenylyltransferase [Bacteroides sp.]
MKERPIVAVMGGSFNPVHIGHLLLADYIVQFTGVDEVWMMLSPQNPLKANSDNLISDSHRWEMLKLACRDVRGVNPCDVELGLPRPSYTYSTLSHLSRIHTGLDFRLVIGSDNWLLFDKWRNHAGLLEKYHPMVYPRPGYPVDASQLPGEIEFVNAPVFDISSTFIRNSIAAGHNMDLFLPPRVGDYINHHQLYKNK